MKLIEFDIKIVIALKLTMYCECSTKKYYSLLFTDSKRLRIIGVQHYHKIPKALYIPGSVEWELDKFYDESQQYLVP